MLTELRTKIILRTFNLSFLNQWALNFNVDRVLTLIRLCFYLQCTCDIVHEATSYSAGQTEKRKLMALLCTDIVELQHCASVFVFSCSLSCQLLDNVYAGTSLLPKTTWNVKQAPLGANGNTARLVRVWIVLYRKMKQENKHKERHLSWLTTYSTVDVVLRVGMVAEGTKVAN